MKRARRVRGPSIFYFYSDRKNRGARYSEWWQGFANFRPDPSFRQGYQGCVALFCSFLDLREIFCTYYVI